MDRIDRTGRFGLISLSINSTPWKNGNAVNIVHVTTCSGYAHGDFTSLIHLPASLMTAPAAAAGRADCPLSYFCTWAGPNFSKGPGKWKNEESDHSL